VIQIPQHLEPRKFLIALSRTITPDTPVNPPGSVICNWQTGDILIGRYTTAAALSGLLPQADELVSETDDAAGPN